MTKNKLKNVIIFIIVIIISFSFGKEYPKFIYINNDEITQELFISGKTQTSKIQYIINDNQSMYPTFVDEYSIIIIDDHYKNDIDRYKTVIVNENYYNSHVIGDTIKVKSIYHKIPIIDIIGYSDYIIINEGE